MQYLFVLAITVFSGLQGQPIFDAHRSGSWYPAQPDALKKTIDNLSENAETLFAMKTDPASIRAIIAPHAGYTYSGNIAASVYNLVRGSDIGRVIILAPSHFVELMGIAVPSFNSYRTPLGIITIDSDSRNSLIKKGVAQKNDAFFSPEHAIEMHVPFIQQHMPNCILLPIVVGDLTQDGIKKITSVLKPLLQSKTLLVVSSDFTHYGASFSYKPFATDIIANIQRLDSSILAPIQHGDRAKFEHMIKTTRDTVCGVQPLRILLELIAQKTFGDVSVRLVSYATSFNTTHDNSNIVSYAGLIVTNEQNEDMLNVYEQRSLLGLARATLEQALKKKADQTLLAPVLTNALVKPQGAFCTLWKKNKQGKKLRGCIGQVHAQQALYQVIQQKIVDAAFQDSRFLPLTAQELPDIFIEISVLKKPRPIVSYKNIVLHKHGIILTNNDKSALFLPTVAHEFGFTLEQTLEQLSLKAGLDKNAWRSPQTTFKVFEAQDFSEK
jgi:AmmeMemoRadiSam system protein B/AmmeMemoRadiSam system protein A